MKSLPIWFYIGIIILFILATVGNYLAHRDRMKMYDEWDKQDRHKENDNHERIKREVRKMMKERVCE